MCLRLCGVCVHDGGEHITGAELLLPGNLWPFHSLPDNAEKRLGLTQIFQPQIVKFMFYYLGELPFN